MVHVVPTFGTEGTKSAQLAPDTTPALMVTVSTVLPVPPVQYMVKVHTPAVIVCAGRAVHAQVVMTPPDWDWIEHAVVREPAVWSMVEATHGADPDPCRYRGLPAA